MRTSHCGSAWLRTFEHVQRSGRHLGRCVHHLCCYDWFAHIDSLGLRNFFLGAARHVGWPKVINFFENFAQPVLDYFPLQLRTSKVHPCGRYCYVTYLIRRFCL